MIDGTTGNFHPEPVEGVISFYVEACCGKIKSHQKPMSCVSQALVHVNVFKQCLKNVGKKCRPENGTRRDG